MIMITRYLKFTCPSDTRRSTMKINILDRIAMALVITTLSLVGSSIPTNAQEEKQKEQKQEQHDKQEKQQDQKQEQKQERVQKHSEQDQKQQGAKQQQQ